MTKALSFIIGLIVGLTLGVICPVLLAPHKVVTMETVTDTTRVTIYDTTHIREPRAVDSVVVRYKHIPVTDTTLVVLERDSIVEVLLPIESRHYADSLYEAWVSGYEPSLDSIRIYSRTHIERIQTSARPSRWHIGPMVGVGYDGRRLSPYIGVGVTYTLLDLHK